MAKSVFSIALAFAVIATLTVQSTQAVTPAHVVAKVGDPMGPGTISTLGPAFVDGNGKVGFAGSSSSPTGERFIWYDTGPIFFASSANPPDVLTGHEGTMGVSNTGGFIYSPSFNGQDAVYTHDGKLLADDDAAPGMPGLFSTFNSRPRMLDDGTAVWVGGTAAVLGGSTTGRAAFRCSDTSNVASCAPVLKTGDAVGGQTIGASGIDFAYDYSGNGLHHIQELILTGPTANDDRVWVDGSIVATEGLTTGGADTWVSFDSLSINNVGNYIFAADTNAAVGIDEVLAYNGSIAVREGNIIDGKTLTSSVNAASINNLNQVTAIWSSSSTETLFLWNDIETSPLGGLALLSVGDQIDTNNDTFADFTVSDFNASVAIAPGLDLGDDGYIYVDVDITPIGGGSSMQAVLRVTPEPTSLVLLTMGLAMLGCRRRR
jgi:hypothetical protein